MPTDPKSTLIAMVHRQSRAIIDTELRRLTLRAPSLSQDDLHIIDAALKELAESAILTHLRNAPHDTAPVLMNLFSAQVGLH
jgi:hypothetical protein